MRITQQDLEQKAKILNSILNRPLTNCERIGKKTVFHEGHFYIDYAYGGVALYEQHDTSGCSDVFKVGHIPKKQLAFMIDAMINGVQLTKRELNKELV
jgi:hypothetical protein